jgi:hypothetical protein
MLRAAVMRGPASLCAWRAWAHAADVERLDQDSQWLMPLLYHNLRAQGVAHPILVRCRNVYLHGWYRNHAALHALASALREEDAAGAPVALVGAAAVALKYHDALGARPIGPLELWVPTSGGERVALRSHVDLPFHLRAGIFDEHADAEVRRRLEPLMVKGVVSAAMGPADQLVHIFAGGASWDARSRLLWVADAARVLQAAPRLDWDVLVAMAGHLGIAARVQEALEYLRGFDVEVPRAALDALAPGARAGSG